MTRDENCERRILRIERIIPGEEQGVGIGSREAMTMDSDAPVAREVVNKSGLLFVPVNRGATPASYAGAKVLRDVVEKPWHRVFGDLVRFLDRQ